MIGALSGFVPIALVVALGAALAWRRVLVEDGLHVLHGIAFNLASPALLFTILLDGDAGRIFGEAFAAVLVGVVATACLSGALSAARRHDAGSAVVAAMCSTYCNAGYLGIPIAVHVLGDVAVVAPVILLQLVVLQPLALGVLDAVAGQEPPSLRRVMTLPIRNPITIASVAGILVSATQLPVPNVLGEALGMVGGLAVPAMLLAFGAALWWGPLPGRGVALRDLAPAVALKIGAQPLIAYGVGTLLGLSEHALLSVAVISCLPTAQSVFLIASRYDRATLLARDATVLSTLICVPVVAVIVGRPVLTIEVDRPPHVNRLDIDARVKPLGSRPCSLSPSTRCAPSSRSRTTARRTSPSSTTTPAPSRAQATTWSGSVWQA